VHCRPSPFLKDNYCGGGFVSEKDRVYLASLVHGAEDDEEEIENGRLVGECVIWSLELR